MRISKGDIVIGGSVAGQHRITYPDDVVFAYNPLYLNIELTSTREDLKNAVKVSFFTNSPTAGEIAKTIDINLYKGKARVYYSRILELFFDNVKNTRVKIVTVRIYNRDRTATICEFSHTVVWGSLALGERFDGYGVFKFNSQRPCMERNRIWFVNFPFTVTLFQPNKSGQGNLLKAKYDNNPYDDSLPLYSPQFNMIGTVTGNGSDRITYQGNLDDSCPTGKNIEAIMYASDKKKFFGFYDENKICSVWGANMPFFYDSTYYNGANRPRTDMKWGQPGSHTFYRFDNQLDELVVIPYGYYGDFGLFELDPSYTFPKAKREATYRQLPQPGIKDRMSVFDETFDYTFFISTEFTTITNLIVNTATTGYYLRWIDRFGCFQYFLFSIGDTTVKNKLSGDNFVEREANDGMWFPNHTRDIHISATDTRKCQANSLTEDIYAYVSTIITSPIIDLYMGKTKNGEEIWCPVNIVATSHKCKAREVLNDLEISFSMPDIQAQTL